MTPAEPTSRLWFWRVWTLIGAIVLLWGAVWVLAEPLSLIFPPLALAFVIVYLLNPSVRWLAERGVPRALSTAGAYLAVLAVVGGLGAVLGPLVADQLRDLAVRLPEITRGVESTLNDLLARTGIESRLTLDLQSEAARQTVEDLLRGNREQVMTVLRGAGSVVTSLLHLLLVVVFAPILAFYLLADLPRIGDGIRRLFPPDTRTEVVEVVERIGRTVGAYFRGMLLVALFVGVATSVGLAVVGLPFWAVIGGTAGLFNLIPLIGPFVGGALGVAVALTVGTGLGQAVAVVIVMVAVQQVDNHVITPNIVARTVQVHPVTVIVALTVAGSLFGILGMFVAIPVVATVKLVLLWLLVTRVPGMEHLAEETDGDGTPEDGSLVAMGRELKAALRRRSVGADPPVASDAESAEDSGTDEAGQDGEAPQRS